MIIRKPEIPAKGGSGFGWSYWKNFLECPLRGYYQSQATGAPSSDKALVGSYFHWLLEQQVATGRVVYDSADFADSCWQEATRLFDAYRVKYPEPEWDVLGVEVPVEAKTEDQVGVLPFTGRLDALVRISATQARMLEVTRGLVLEPGVYIVDHKTVGSKKQDEYDFYANAPQFAYYLALVPEAKGAIINIIQRNKTVLFRSQLVFRPEPHIMEKHKEQLRLAKRLRDELGEQRPNRACCFTFGVCPYLSRCNSQEG